MSEIEKLRETLSKIAKLAKSVSKASKDDDDEDSNVDSSESRQDADAPSCTIKMLPRRLLLSAANTARQVNPVNAPLAFAAMGAQTDVMDPLSIAVLTAKYWGPTPRQLTVSFMESTPTDLRRRILLHMNAWKKTSCISFVETGGTGQIRISRAEDGYWSYLGTDVLHIPQNRPTMNLQDFSMSTPESEYKRVVRHETGHTLGFPHEHMRTQLVARIDRTKAYAYFLETQGWSKAVVDAQVLTPLKEASIMGTPSDQTSIMCYQLPARITKDGLPIVGGVDINATDFAFAGRIYPLPTHGTSTDSSSQQAASTSQDDWSEDEDIEVDL
jgi:hypothetical protein